MKISELDVYGYFEFEDKNYRYWRIGVGDDVFNVAEVALEKVLFPDFYNIIPKNKTAEWLDEKICYYATDEEELKDIRSAILGE